MKDGYAQARFIVEHDGWRADQIALKDTLPDPAPYRRANLKTVEDRIAMLEKLLDLSSGDDELRVRIEKLAKYIVNG